MEENETYKAQEAHEIYKIHKAPPQGYASCKQLLRDKLVSVVEVPSS